MTTTIKAHVRLEGGQLLSNANAHLIQARRTTPTDRNGNCLDSPYCRDKTPYFERWVIKKEKKGFIFVEVTHGGGICGHHRNVRELVIATLCGLSSDIVVEAVDEQAQPAEFPDRPSVMGCEAKAA